MGRGKPCPLSNNMAAATLVKLSTMPTERSMPAVRMTKVIPTVTTPSIAVCRITLVTLRCVRKVGESRLPTRAIARKAMMAPAPGPRRWSTSLLLSRQLFFLREARGMPDKNPIIEGHAGFFLRPGRLGSP